jgi:putative Holliday junction resolvase
MTLPTRKPAAPAASDDAERAARSGEAGRVLAVDLGERRMGLALSDPLGLTAQGLPTAERRNRREDMNYLKSLGKRHGASRIVVGDPINMDGTAGPQSEAARAFATRLAEHTGLAVSLWDERLTSVEANRMLRQSGLGPAERAKSVDQLAAVLLLENYLDAHRALAPRAEGPHSPGHDAGE